jgi:hypothetical protein
MRKDLRIAFFHHTPFPAADVFNVLPWRREIVESLLACDEVGFVCRVILGIVQKIHTSSAIILVAISQA